MIKGYDIIDREADGSDEYGIKYWVTCKNGYSSRSWEVDYVKNKSINKFYNELFQECIFIKDRPYYLKPTKYIDKISDIKFINYETYKVYTKNFEIFTEFYKKCISIINFEAPYYKLLSYNNEFLYYRENLRIYVNNLIHKCFNNEDKKKAQINELSYEVNINLNFLD